MLLKNRINLERELYIFQRKDVKAARWYASLKLQGFPRKNVALGVMSQEEAAKLARRELTRAEETLEEFGETALLGKNRICDAVSWFRKNGHNYLSPSRYRVPRVPQAKCFRVFRFS